MARIHKAPQEELSEVAQEEENLLWWGYKHSSGTYQAKRYSGPLDTDEARDSPFCEQVVGPFPAKDRDEALQLVKEKTTPKDPPGGYGGC
jgi:hypothetical protein